jgi:2Fe-2S ferredoxin
MTRITFVEHDGKAHTVDALDGKSVMQTAIDNAIPGITGDCGGSCNCATCHAYVEGRWDQIVPAASDNEQAVLEGALHRRDSSRLTCQIVVTTTLDGLTVNLPVSQF